MTLQDQVISLESAKRLTDFFVYCLSHGAPYDIKDISKWSIAESKKLRALMLGGKE